MRNLYTLLLSFLLLSCVTFGQNNNSTTEKSIYSNEMQEGSLTVAFDTVPFTKSSKMLDEDIYWAIIENSLKETDNQEDQELFLISEIQKLTPIEMVGFRLRTDQLLFDSYNSELWCAAYIVSAGISDGGFEYFRCWLISRGKEVFYSVKANPDSLIKQVVEDKESYEFEGFWYVAMNAFKNSTGEDLYSFIDYDQFVTNDENYPLLEFNWNVEEPQTMKNICPVLFKSLWKQ
ncbi:DUF4240 domain-containing protein [Flavobacterium sp. W22_SRS_FP1]|uniref:DUF4240 domain-containing protein n=1 Tax=Flavobacterium sp. W22_SRS_FP1 TaxID=3240276 RepID=UPI003F90972C